MNWPHSLISTHPPTERGWKHRLWGWEWIQAAERLVIQAHVFAACLLRAFLWMQNLLSRTAQLCHRPLVISKDQVPQTLTGMVLERRESTEMLVMEGIGARGYVPFCRYNDTRVFPCLEVRALDTVILTPFHLQELIDIQDWALPRMPCSICCQLLMS